MTAVGEGDRPVAQALTAADGTFTISAALPVTALRIERTAQASETFASAALTDPGNLTLRLTSTPIRLPAVSATATSVCGPAFRNDGSVSAIWEEARKSLQITLLTERSTAAAYSIERVVRTFDAREMSLLEESAQRWTVNTPTPFRAIDAGLVAAGGWAESMPDGGMQYYAPDAAILLSEQFIQQHCFRAEQTGEGILLHFVPTLERAGLPELEGVMVLSPATGELMHLRFRYVGVPSARLPQRPGGEIYFHAAANGLRIVREWSLRMPELVLTRSNRGDQTEVHRIREQGGVVRSYRDLATGTHFELSRAPISSEVTEPARSISDTGSGWSRALACLRAASSSFATTATRT